MNNYEYIIASLPLISASDRTLPDTDAIIGEIRNALGARDAASLDFVLSIYDSATDPADFYGKATVSKSAFIRDYFGYDLNVKNTKVGYLNKALDRPEGTDIVLPSEEEFEDRAKVLEILSGKDILARERALDELMWNKADELTVLHIFDLDVILGFVVRLKIIDRWAKLDENAGREFFRKLVNEIRNNRTI